MFSTPDYYLGSEVATRRDRIARDWESANAGRRRRRLRRQRNRLRLPAKAPLPQFAPPSQPLFV
jgi:hypothetical protein